MTFLINNIGTLLTGIVLLAVVVLVLRTMIRDKKAGKADAEDPAAAVPIHVPATGA